MAPVIDNLGVLSDTDVRAMAIYLAGVIGEPTPQRHRDGEALLARTRAHGPGRPVSGDSMTLAGSREAGGAMIYASACAPCHESGRPLPFGGVDLALSTAPQGPNPHNVINVVLTGIAPAEGERSAIMPSFASVLSDEQLVELIGY